MEPVEPVELVDPEGDIELEEPEGDIELEEEPEGDIELLEEPEGDIEPVDEPEGEVTLGEAEEGFGILELEDPADDGRVALDGLEHAPKAKADTITKGSASDFNFMEK